MKRYPAILSTLYDQDHVILPTKLREIEQMILAKAAGANLAYEGEKEEPAPSCFTLDGEELSMDAVASAPSAAQFVAVMPLFGTMFQHGSLDMDISGGMSTERFGRQFTQLLNNPNVKTIVIEAHSPGGQVFGVEELASLIFAGREQKRIVTSVNSMAASGGLWVSTAAKKVFVTPGGQMGSMGVVRIHEDTTAMEEKLGVKTTLVAVPDAKVEGWLSLDEETAAIWKTEVTKSYQKFAQAMARNRGVSKEEAIANFGGGRILRAEEAVKAGLADGIATKAEVIAAEINRLKPRAKPAGSAAVNENTLAIAEAE